MRQILGTSKHWIIGVALFAWLTGMSTTALAQTNTVTYSLDDLWLIPDTSHPGSTSQPMTGSFEWTYDVGDFENGSGQFIELDTPWYNPGIAELNITIEVKSIEFSLKGNYHDRGFDMNLVLITPLSPDLPSSLDTTWSKFDIQYGISYQGHVESGSIVPDSPLLPLSVDTHTISAATGGMVNFSLDATADNANRQYLLLGSLTGTSPGLPLPGGHAVLPCNWDIFTDIVITLINGPVFQNFHGYLDGNGYATAILDASQPLPSSGFTMSFAYALFPQPAWNFASNPVNIDIVP